MANNASSRFRTHNPDVRRIESNSRPSGRCPLKPDPRGPAVHLQLQARRFRPSRIDFNMDIKSLAGIAKDESLPA